MEQNLNFTFTAEETNLVMNALASQPYSQVFKLISNIQRQAEAQLTPPEKTE